MARITGTIRAADVAKMSPRALDGYIRDIHRKLIEEHGHGMMNSSTDPRTGDIDYTFDYAEGFTAPPPGSHLAGGVEQVDDELVHAVKTARVKLCNMSAVKLDGGKYHPIDPDDGNAANTCAAINRLEQFLAKHDPEGRVHG